MDKIKDWWDSLTTTRQRLVMAIATVLFIIIASALLERAEAQPVDPAMTGHYFAPGLERQGLTLVAWPANDEVDAGALVIWYTYVVGGPDQMWLISDVIGEFGERVPLFLTVGQFPGVDAELIEVGEIEIRQFGDGLRMEYQLNQYDPDCDPRPLPGPLPGVCRGVLDYLRLTPSVMQ